MNSKRVHFLAFALTLSVLAGCVREQDPVSERGSVMTIRASLPEKTFTRAGFSVPEREPGLHLAWQAGDCILVIGDGGDSAVYTIDEGFTDHWATFSGPVVAGSTFDILTPGTYESLEEAEAGNPALTQTGNGSTAHLKYNAALVGVDTYEQVAFIPDWATTHGGTLYQNGVLKLVVTLPEGVAAVTRAAITLVHSICYSSPLSIPISSVY